MQTTVETAGRHSVEYTGFLSKNKPRYRAVHQDCSSTSILAATVGAGLTPRASGGKCSSIYDDGNCICLDKDVCQNNYGGAAISGSENDVPCPGDPTKSGAAMCPGFGAGSKCK